MVVQVWISRRFWEQVNLLAKNHWVALLMINSFNPSKVFPSAHDTCDLSLARMENELKAETEVLSAGRTYRF